MSRRFAPVVLVIAIAACTSTAGTVSTTTTTLEARPTTTTLPPPVVFRVGVIGAITTDNWFAALEGDTATDANLAAVATTKTGMFAPSLPGFVQIPRLAATSTPAQPRQEGENWVVEQPIRDDRVWSDGTPVTARDLVLYYQAVRDLGLGPGHASHFSSSVVDVTAPDDHTVRVVFSSRPGMVGWQTGVAEAPFIPSAFWEPIVDRARAAVAASAASITDDAAVAAIVAASQADDDERNDLEPSDVTPADIDAYRAETSLAAGRASLTGASGAGEPSLGPVMVTSWEQEAGAITAVPNPTYFDWESENTLYSDGSFRVANAGRGEDQVYGGDGEGSVIAHYLETATYDEIRYVGSTSAQDAYESLARGAVDFVWDTTGISTELQSDLGEVGDLEFSDSVAGGFRYLAFNLRKPPMSDRAFRSAVATIIDKERVIDEALGGEVFPAYTIVNPGLVTHYNPDVARPGWGNGEPLTEDLRFSRAIEILQGAGYTWSRELVINYDDDGGFQDITPGVGLTMPNGQKVPELTVLAPGPSYDPFRATFSEWIVQWMNQLGIPTTIVSSDFTAIVSATFPPQTPDSALAWDMYVLGWGAGDVSLPGGQLRAFFHSDQDSVLRGGFNTTGYHSADFDALADEFDQAESLSEAAGLTRQMDALIARDLPYVVLFRAPVVEARSGRIRFPVESIIGGHSGLAAAWPNAVTVGP